MHRKEFISTTAAMLTSAYPSFPSGIHKEIAAIIPPYLKKGDLIGITAPAGYISIEEIEPSIRQMETWGYRIKIGETIGKRDFTFGGTDDERAVDFQQMLDDARIKAIMCARGGYGAVRIIDKLNWAKLKLNPKWIIGFSDITVFHSHLNRNFGISSIHSKMCNSFPDDPLHAEAIQVETIESIHRALSGLKMKYEAIPNPRNKPGLGEGSLVGGNLKMIETLSGTSSDLNTTGKILFVEDTGEYMYNIDRMFWNLKRTKKLSLLKGLIVGGFKVKVDEESDDFGKTLEEVVLEKVKAYKYPVCFDFPVGHQKNNFALKCGIRHRLKVSPDKVVVDEV